MFDRFVMKWVFNDEMSGNTSLLVVLFEHWSQETCVTGHESYDHIRGL